MPHTHGFRQVDVFATGPLTGNPVAVVHDADDLTDEQMAAFARWTNLSETTFLLTPTDPAADYRVRIWTPGGELPFAGHPTLGTAHAWREAGGVPQSASGEGDVVQECAAGLVTVRRDVGPDGADLPAFAAPPLRRSGSVGPEDLARIARGLRVSVADIEDAAWADNGPGWVAARLRDAAAVLAVEPDYAAFGDLKIGVVGTYAPGESDAAVEVRAFVPDGYEDPVTGSLNASLGQWLAGGLLPPSYVASQGTALGRRGRVHVRKGADGVVWVGGAAVTTIAGTVTI